MFGLIRPAVAALTAACAIGDAGSAPSDPPMRAGMSALRIASTIDAAAATDVAIRVFYLRSNEAQVELTRIDIPLDNTAQQQVPVSVDITGCLNDPQRVVTGDVCAAVVEMTLLRGATTLDVESTGPISLRAGEQTTVSNPVTLREVSAIRLAPAHATVIVGQAVKITATPLDATGAPLAGRTVQWSVANSAIARVDSTGVLTGVASGQTTLSAATGGRVVVDTVTVVPLSRLVAPVTSNASAARSSSSTPTRSSP